MQTFRRVSSAFRCVLKERDPERPFTVWEWTLGDTGRGSEEKRTISEGSEEKERRRKEETENLI
jgi:hypothetical protein